MRFKLVVCTLIAALLDRTLGNVADKPLLDYVALPGFELPLGSTSSGKVTFSNGKLEGLTSAVKIRDYCDGQGECNVSLAGLLITYKAVLGGSKDKEVDVEVVVLYGILILEKGQTAGGKTFTKTIRARSLTLYVRKPHNFTSHRRDNMAFEEKLKRELVTFLQDFALTDTFQLFLNAAL